MAHAVSLHFMSYNFCRAPPDVPITLAPESERTLFDLAQMRDELRAIFGREVSLLTRRGEETSQNALRRESILASARPLYVACIGQEVPHAHA